jgi:hypothetical protein
MRVAITQDLAWITDSIRSVKLGEKIALTSLGKRVYLHHPTKATCHGRLVLGM